MSTVCRSTLVLVFAVAQAAALRAAEPPRLSVLFLGDNGHHRPAERARQLIPVLERRGVDITYTDELSALDPQSLSRHDCLIIYANWETIEPSQEKALLDYVASGKGFVPIHCASYCFRNSPGYVDLVGAQFLRHGFGEFLSKVVDPEHPAMRDLWEFWAWDETYVHTRHNDDRRVLQTRKEGDAEEPWTWVRTHGRGRVFYTAYGHDHLTWGHPGFHALIERGIRWAAGDDRVVDNGSKRPTDFKPFQYAGAKFPNYLPPRAGGGQGEPFGQMQLPLDPSESMRHMVLPPGFEVRLFASEPDIVKPIAMAWDARARLWIAETTDYPNNQQPEGQGNDRITICEDSDGDGRADKFTIFADRLSIPTSLTFASGGIIVHQAPQTLFLKDVDGDDRADVRRVLFSGWSTSDTHAGPSNMHWGFDNWIWGIVGYSGFRGRVGGEEHAFSTGFYRFRPDGSKLEFIRNTNNNSWGVGFTEEGLVFGSTANRNPSVYMPIANRYYESVRGWSSRRLESTAVSARFYPITDRVRQVDHHGHFTAGAGHAIYTARSFPRVYWNRAAFVNGPTGHLLGTFLLEPRGSGFQTRNSWNLVASDDEWTAPTMAEVGPDGAVWMIDWYNYIVQHNPTPHGFKTGKGNAYMTPLRDKTHGRIYRIVYRNAKPRHPLRPDDAGPVELVAALKNDNMFWRKTAQRLLVERGKLDVLPALMELTEDTSVDEIGLNAAALHALWVMHGLGALDGSDEKVAARAEQALLHPSRGVRRAALQVLPRNSRSAAAILRANSLCDADAQVRLAGFLALSEMPPSEAAAIAIAVALRDPANAKDRWIPHAATSAAAAHARPFLEAAAAERWSDEVAEVVAEVVARAAEHYARDGSPDGAGSLMARLLGAERRVADSVVAGLARGWPEDRPPDLDEDAERALVGLLRALSPGARGQLITLATRWDSGSLDEYTAEIAASFLAAARDDTLPDEERAAAAKQLVEFRQRDADAVDELADLIDAQTSPALAAGLLDALGASRSPRVGRALVEAFRDMTPSIRRKAQVVFLRRAGWTKAMLRGARDDELDLSLLSLDQKTALTDHPDREVAALATELLGESGDLPSPDRQEVIEKFIPLVKRKGNAARGKEVFKELCAKCHMHGGEGKDIGPDLTGMAALPKSELLVNILDPSRSVAATFHQYTVVTTKGLILNGMLASESRTAIEIFDSEGERHMILREDIAQFEGSRKSLMPEGFENQVSPDGLVDLLEFLADRGRYLPLPLARAATIVSTRGMFYSEDSHAERLIFPDWKPKVFDGVPFLLVDPRGDKIPNVILLRGPRGKFPPKMPRSVSLPCNAPAEAIHLLSGVSGWGSQGGGRPTVSMIVRLHYADGGTEDHELLNGVHFADYIGRFDVPESKFAFKLRNQQIRYLAIRPRRGDVIRAIDFVKGSDHTAPVVMAVTVETPE